MSNFVGMRAIEFINKSRATIPHIDDVKRVIEDLKPLRLDKKATDAYYNAVLCADIRKRNYLLQQELYNSGNAMQQKQPEYQSLEGEIPIEYASEVRETLFKVIKDDESFGYLFFLLGTEQNQKHQSEPIDCIPNPTKIKIAVGNCRDSYPHKRLDDYLDDDFNYEQYNMLVGNKIYQDDELLEFFNEVYYLYDQIRCVKEKMSDVRDFCKKLSFRYEKDNYFIIATLIVMIDRFESNDTQMMRCRTELYKMISSLEPKYKKDASTPVRTESAVALSKDKGIKIDYIRVINAMYESGMFTKAGKGRLTKKDVFEAFGAAVNLNLSDYDKDLSRALGDSTSLDKHLKIFDTLKAKMLEIFNSK